MTDLRKAAEMALEALEALNHGDNYKTHNAATALRQALAQPEQEPVAWVRPNGEIVVRTDYGGRLYYSEQNVYTEQNIKQAVLAEREACAKIVEKERTRWAVPVDKYEYNEMWDKCVIAIRARSEK